MQITFYVDIIFFMNCIANLFVLLITAFIAKKKIIIWKMIAGAMFGAGMLLVFVLYPSLFMGWKGIVISVGISMGTVAIAFGEKKGRLIRTWFLSTTIMVLTGGIMNYLKYIFDTPVLQVTKWFLLFGVSSVSIVILISNIQKSKKQSDNVYLIQIKHGEFSTIETVYMDTGNMLMDPMFQKPVIVLSEDVVKKCLTEEETLVLEQYRKNGRLDYNILLTCRMQKKDCFHEIAYQSVGNLSGKMLCMLIDEVDVLGEGMILKKQPVAIVQSALFEEKEYQGLLHRECIRQKFGG